ncbi:MAG: acyl-CoA dehydrogenase family protein, partial [Pseudomonas sp.]
MIPSEQDVQIRDMARQFARERLQPFAAEWDREHRFPAEAIAEMGQLGFM